MKTLVTSMASLWLLASCQQNPQSSTMPQGASAATSPVKYRLVFIKHEEKHQYSNELYLRDFEATVNRAIAEGWQPLGGVATAGMGSLPIQAMVKTE